MTKTHPLALNAVAAAVACLTLPASAVVLNPGQTVALSGTTAAADPRLAGVVLADEVRGLPLVNADPTDPTQGYFNDQQLRVVRSDLDGTLRFAWRLINRDEFTMPTKRLEVSGFAGFELDADWRVDGLGEGAPATASRSVDGDTVVFDFGDFPIAPDVPDAPNSSRFVFLQTDAVAFDDGGSTLFVGGLSSPTFGALDGTFRPVPEPAGLLLLTGAAAVTFGRRRR